MPHIIIELELCSFFFRILLDACFILVLSMFVPECGGNDLRIPFSQDMPTFVFSAIHYLFVKMWIFESSFPLIFIILKKKKKDMHYLQVMENLWLIVTLI